MKGLNLIKRLASALTFEHAEASYAQAGEDRILRFLFDILQIEKPSYLDIGAHHPTYLSNTYLFYKQGSRGVCIEPDPTLHRRIQEKRPGDTCLNIGIGTGGARNLEFFIFDNPTMNTFSPQIRDEQVASGRVNTEKLQIQVRDVNDIISQYFPKTLDLVSLDTEGMDLAILESFDFKTHRPAAFCVETLENTVERKITPIIEFMVSQRYRVYADTYLNTIFVAEDQWLARPAILSQASNKFL